MIPAIAALLGGGISPASLALKSLSDVFEAYIWALVIRAAKLEGAAVSYEDVLGNPATSLIFRTSPGYIFSTAKPYTHAVIVFAASLSWKLTSGSELRESLVYFTKLMS